MAGVSSCMKYSMFIFNFIFWVCGCIILGVSIWSHVNKSDHKEFSIGDNLFSSDYLLITVGAIIMVLGFLGCCGAIKESQCMLLLFFIGLLLILILQVVAGILEAVNKSEVGSAINKTITQETLQLLKTDESLQQKLLAFEKKNKCCGLMNGENDWPSNIKDGCVCLPEDVKTSACNSKGKYKESCSTVITNFLKNNIVILMGIAFGLAFIEVLGLVFSMSLYCQIQRK